MTPQQILDDAVARFVVCYIEDPNEQVRLLRQALGKFQDKAGLIRESWGEGPILPFPPDFHDVASCSDAKRRYVPWHIALDEEGKPCGVSLVLNSRHEPPFCLAYFCNLRDWELDKKLPGDCAALVGDYLEAIMAVKNTERARYVCLQADMTEAAQALPTDQDLRTRISDLEKEMQENKAICPPASMF